MEMRTAVALVFLAHVQSYLSAITYLVLPTKYYLLNFLILIEVYIELPISFLNSRV